MRSLWARGYECCSAQETIAAFFNAAWFRAVDCDFLDEELSLLPITKVQGYSFDQWIPDSNMPAPSGCQRLPDCGCCDATLQEQHSLVRDENQLNLAQENDYEDKYRVRPLGSRAHCKDETSFYDILKIPRAASAKEIHSAYVALLRTAEVLPAKLCTAYETLLLEPEKAKQDHQPIKSPWSNPVQRTAYDHRPTSFFLDARKAKEGGDANLAAFVHGAPVKCNLRHASAFKEQALQIKRRCIGADVLVVWIMGNASQIAGVERVLQQIAEEVDGLRASTSSTVRFCEDRIIIRGGKVPLAVATLQKKVLWRGEVTSSNGSKQSGWGESAERNVGAHQDLVPDREPDTDEVEAILLQQCAQAGTTAEKAMVILDSICRGQNAMSYTLLRLLTSKVVYHHMQESKVATRFIVTVVRCWSIHKLQLPLYEVYRNTLLLVLWQIPWVFTTQTAQLTWPQVFETVLLQHLQGQGAGHWVPWTTVLKWPNLTKMIDSALQARHETTTGNTRFSLVTGILRRGGAPAPPERSSPKSPSRSRSRSRTVEIEKVQLKAKKDMLDTWKDGLRQSKGNLSSNRGLVT
eukprot:Skav209747  [mRNA]  locus=scaffold9:39494:47580:+ [translate_table: standard]